MHALLGSACLVHVFGHGASQAHLSIDHHLKHPGTTDDLQNIWGDEYGFSGLPSFARLPYTKCLTTPSIDFDIAIIGAPFDTAVSYRPGARFGPRAIRSASARHTIHQGFNPRAGINPYSSWATILDCGDIPITPFDNELALTQMTAAYKELLTRSSKTTSLYSIPKLITLGGDHSIALPALRALHAVHKTPVAVLHFDAHLDTESPSFYDTFWRSKQSEFNHGSVFWMAAQEGLILNGSSVHAGLRMKLSGSDWHDYEHDSEQGFFRIVSDDIDEIGTAGIIKLIMDRIGTETKVYLSVDIDVLDPSAAPGTGTPEIGGWTSRELIRILRGIEGLNIVGADIVEVAPAYDNNGETTAMAAAQIVFEMITNMVKKGLVDMGQTTKTFRREEL